MKCKRQPDERYLSLLDHGEEPEFVALDDVEEFIRNFGNELEEVRWRHEIDAPG